MAKGNKTDLERSHSKASNFKLTMIAFLGAIGFACVWVGIAFIFKGEIKGFNLMSIAIPMTIAGGVVLLLSYFLIARFTR